MSWVRAQVASLGSGFGRVTVDGQELVFDSGVAPDGVPAVGDWVLVEIGAGRLTAMRSLEPRFEIP